MEWAPRVSLRASHGTPNAELTRSPRAPAARPAILLGPLAKTPRKNTRSPRLGVWIFGAYGGLATTVVLGARAIARGLAAPQGLATESDLCRGLGLAPIDSIVFGGHEMRPGDWAQSALEIHQDNGTLPLPLIEALKKDLKQLSKNVRQGALVNAGRTIERVTGAKKLSARTLRQEADRLQQDLRDFQTKNRLDSVVCVNLTSTEPELASSPAHRSLAAFERAIDKNDTRAVRSSSLYAYAAAKLGLPFVHFTPSNAALLPAIRELFEQNGAPYAGMDGKTGETLVKSALAPMFKIRDLRVLSWQGYNILGDRDGAVLADSENKQSKIATKDALLPQILGYPLHSHVGIDYVPSLHDHKTAWDFIHFEGFLGHRMVMQFVWQGCDAILAAPLVLDLARWCDFAKRHGEKGPMKHLACYFKKPIETDTHDLHAQWRELVDYANAHRNQTRR